MSADPIAIVIAIAGMAGTAITFIISRREKRLESDANIAVNVGEAYGRLVGDLQTQMSNLEERIDDIEAENKILRARVTVAEKVEIRNMELERQNEILIKEKCELEKQVSALQSRVSELETIIIKLRERIKKLDGVDE